MKFLIKDNSKRAYCDSWKDIEDFINAIADIGFVKAIKNCVNNSA